jgi:sugar phosphate isomerase/epimerase
MHPRLSVHTVGFGPVPVRGLLAELTGYGIRRFGMPAAQLAAGGVAANAAALRAAGVEVLDVVEPAAFTLADPARWPAQQGRLRACVAAAAAVSAPILYLTTGAAGPLTWDDAAVAFAEAIAEVRDDARAAGVTLAIENTTTLRADLGFVHRLADTIDAAALAGVAVCADLCAAWTDRDLLAALAAGSPAGPADTAPGSPAAGAAAGRSTVARSPAGEPADAGPPGGRPVGAGEIVLVQVADYVLGTLRAPDRAVPGDGDIPIERQLRWLAETGYTGPIELELLGPRITAEGPARAAARAAAVIERWI